MTVLATIVVLGVLIFVHELGHFLAAKAVGIEVQRFSIGLGPRLAGFKRGETEYILAWVPLGGYVKMGGMDDEVMERIEGGPEERPRQPGPRDFDAKPVWARAFVISAGVIMNMLFAFAVYVGATAYWGLSEVAETRLGTVQAASLPAGAEGLASLPVGARIVEVAGRPVEHWGDVRDALLDGPAGAATIRTADPAAEVAFTIPADHEARVRLFGSLGYWIDARVGPVNTGSPAEKGGLQRGDRILAVDGTPVTSWYDFVREIERRPGVRTEITLERRGQTLVRAVVPDEASREDAATGETVTVGRVGIFQPTPELVYIDVGPARAVALGWRETVAVSALILDFLRDLFTGNVSPRSVGSIVTIGQASGQAAAAGVETFLRFMALFSVNLAILNLLPIPILDGGHLVFLAIEAVRGRALSVEQRIRWSQVGLIVVMGLMVWALSNDVLRLFGL
ncbi:MAG: RIP metalloprotease RseP [Gemmatimonadetes bacterium]|nr:MAG: RIP metalloprotease RseP [Gemmatimonadota bacterium]